MFLSCLVCVGSRRNIFYFYIFYLYTPHTIEEIYIKYVKECFSYKLACLDYGKGKISATGQFLILFLVGLYFSS